MKNYFFVLNEERRRKLQRANVVFCDFEIDGLSGAVVDQDNINRALEVLGARAVGESPSSFDGIVHLALQFEGEGAIRPEPQPPQFRVEVANWDGGNQDGFVKAVEESLLPVVRTDIVLSVPHGCNVAPVSDGKFRILFWSSPDGQKENIETPEKIWGTKVACRDSGFEPSGQGIAITDPETGWVVAEIVRNNLYIHHDICHYGTSQEIAIFRRLLQEVVNELSTTPEEKAERAHRLAEAKREKSRAAYVKECSKRFEKTTEGTRRAIVDGENRIQKLQQELAKRIREVAGAKRKIEQLEACKGGELEKYGREFDKLLAVPKVLDVQVADGVVKVFTDTLYCVDPRTKLTHEIGRFRIEIYENCSNGGVRWYNLTHKIRGYSHWGECMAPHINGRGEACFGSTAEIWPELIGNYEFAAAAMVAIQFVESVNTDDAAGKHIISWPVATTGKEE